ncbi:BID domain-containing T4SS effector [Bartonella sp. cb54]|uniref:BID domain-containing T4SS effector n=1 Tax=Bartonella sp. cb54 TaxID=3385560 RepID=UPI0039A4E5C4
MLKAKEIYTGHAANYFYARSNTPKNKYGIKNSKDLYRRWIHDGARAIVNLEREDLPKQFNSEYLKYIHHSLFRNTFDWAGKTRNMPTILEDGTLAFMTTMKSAQSGIPFANNTQIEQGLKEFDQTLAEKNNLQNLSHEEFVENAAKLFTSLHHIHPFVAGGEYTERIFFEKLAKSAGHKLDFSLVTKARIENANVAAERYNYLSPMKHIFDDISHPQKAAALKEAMSYIHYTEHKNINNYIVMSAKEGVNYTGTYRGHGAKSFIINAKNTYIVGLVDHLTPEQRKTLKPGDTFTFTVPNTEDLKNILIPKETLTPLTKEAMSAKVAKNPTVQELRQEIQYLSKIVYNTEKVLDKKLESINQNPNLSKKLPTQIARHPQSFHKLAGFCFCGISTKKYQDAQECVWSLSQKVEAYIEAVGNAQKEIIKEHKAEQQRRGQQVEMPSKDLQEALSLPKQRRQEALQASPTLQKELSDFMEKINTRLSVSEREAINYRKYGKLIESVGISQHKAEEITKIFTQAKHAQQQQQQTQVVRLHRSQALSMTN